MKITKQVKEFTEKTTDVVCDHCGKSCKTDYGFEFMSLSANWGFKSNHDLETWTAQLCENCVEALLKDVRFDKRLYVPGITA